NNYYDIISMSYLFLSCTEEIFIKGCDEKIEKKGDNVGLSFYAFFKNKNDNPELLMEAAH
ncbi:hypothetical protein RR13_20255, partial [Acinetobacter baumannii]